MEQRTSIIDHLDGHVMEVSLDYFFSNVLPPLPEGVDILKVLESLREDSVVDGRWAAFQLNPSEDDRHESIVYNALGQAFDSIITAASQCPPGAKQTLEFKLSPTEALHSEEDTGIRPNGFLILKKQTIPCPDPLNITKPGRSRKRSRDSPSWYDIAATAEFTKSADSEERDKVSSRLSRTLIKTLKVILERIPNSPNSPAHNDLRSPSAFHVRDYH